MSDILRDFDKKNEIPKVKIPKFATGGICDDAMLPTFDMFSGIDEIVKDITKKKDNVIAMEFTKCIGELLRKNGVVTKITEYTRDFEKENTFETRYGVSIDKLDFSEHDKQFNERIGFLTRKNEKLFDENQELKQRIAELENNEVEKSTKCTTVIVAKEINGQEYVRLEDFMSVVNDFQAEIGT